MLPLMPEKRVMDIVPLQALPEFVDPVEDVSELLLVIRLYDIQWDPILPNRAPRLKHGSPEVVVTRVPPVENPLAEGRRIEKLRDRDPGGRYVAVWRRREESLARGVEIDDPG